ncbi:MAG: SfiI family type II restriction endonuclease [Desulfomonile tiedjei]|nr:SfiI family type II restriction endonuclease [Desulfomonile tiedjei]
MFLDPNTLENDLDRLESIEKASMRFVTHALCLFRLDAATIYSSESDKQADIGENITREALDSLGVHRIPVRLFGKSDYKKACYYFHPDYALRQALFVDSKAEKGSATARVQVSQTSLVVRQTRQGVDVEVPGSIPKVLTVAGENFPTTTIFVKYVYDDSGGQNALEQIRISCLPNGFLQGRYNPTCDDSIWSVGPDSPAREEEFRTRLNYAKLKAKCKWRVQDIKVGPEDQFAWEE